VWVSILIFSYSSKLVSSRLVFLKARSQYIYISLAVSHLAHVPAELVGHFPALKLLVSSRGDLSIVDGDAKLGSEAGSINKETVVLVGGLGKASLLGLSGDGLTVGHDGVGHLDGGSHKVVLEVLEANLQVELSGSGNDVLTGFLGVAQDHGIGLGKALHSLDELGEVGGVLGLNGAPHNGRHTEFHGLDAVGILSGGNGSTLEQVLVNSDQGTGVSGGHVGNLLGVPSHHDDGALDVLDPDIGLLAGNVVGSHDADLLAGGNLSGENTAEGVETSLVGRGDHLTDVHGHGAPVGGVAGADGLGGLIVQGSVIQGIDTVLLGNDGGRKVEHDHLEDGISGREPLRRANKFFVRSKLSGII